MSDKSIETIEVFGVTFEAEIPNELDKKVEEHFSKPISLIDAVESEDILQRIVNSFK